MPQISKIVLPKNDPAFINVPAFGTKELFLGLDGELYTKDASISTVSATDTVTVVLFNPTVSAIDIASTTLRVEVSRR